jgi:hypothetical protein
MDDFSKLDKWYDELNKRLIKSMFEQEDKAFLESSCTNEQFDSLTWSDIDKAYKSIMAIPTYPKYEIWLTEFLPNKKDVFMIDCKKVNERIKHSFMGAAKRFNIRLINIPTYSNLPDMDYIILMDEDMYNEYEHEFRGIPVFKGKDRIK